MQFQKLLNRTLLMSVPLLLAACGSGQEPSSVSDSPESVSPAASAQPVDAQPVAAPEAQPLQIAQSDGDAPSSGRFQMGTHYERLSPTQPTSSGPEQVEVAEIFWYGCPHCFNFDPYLKQWQPDKPAYVSFVRVPAVWNPLVRLHARAFYTAEALGKGEEMHDAFFNEIHVNGNLLDTEEALAEFFGRFGVPEEDFKTAFDSFAVHTKLQRADELSRRYRITSVPSVVVNGKYTANASMAGGYDQLIDLIDELAASERSN